MKIIAINSVNSGSTGNIMLGIAKVARGNGFEVITCVPKSRDNLAKQVEHQLLIGNRFSRNLHIKLAELTGFHGCFSIFSTINFIRRLKTEKPDLIHLHNLHGDYINLPLLFRYIKREKIPAVWTLHDCWAMTGQCPYFTMVKCESWKTGCHDCPQLNGYPASRLDRTQWMWKHKKKWFGGVQNMTITTPSKWLAGIVKQSYLKDYPIRVIYNGINLDVFKPTHSNFKEKYHLEDKYIVLGVAASWGKRKGLDVLVELSKRLDERFQVVLVGAQEGLAIPDHIITIQHTESQKELAEIYTAADVFANPTREEVLGLVNVEALACGTPVVTFNSGGSPECVDEASGIVIRPDDVQGMTTAIVRICEKKTEIPTEACMRCAARFDGNSRFAEFVDLYTSYQ